MFSVKFSLMSEVRVTKILAWLSLLALELSGWFGKHQRECFCPVHSRHCCERTLINENQKLMYAKYAIFLPR